MSLIGFLRRKKDIEEIENSQRQINEKPIEQASYTISAVDVEDMDELIAVITAAVAASLNSSTHNVIVKAIKRIPNTSPAWNRAARLDLTTNKLYY
jgi:hypothetical protein